MSGHLGAWHHGRNATPAVSAGSTLAVGAGSTLAVGAGSTLAVGAGSTLAVSAGSTLAASAGSTGTHPKPRKASPHREQLGAVVRPLSTTYRSMPDNVADHMGV